MKNKIFALTVLLIHLISVVSIQPLAIGNDYSINIIVVEEGFSFYYLECDIAPVLKDDSALVPLRAVAEAFHFEVTWNDFEQSITISKDDKQIKLWIGNTIAILNGKEEKLPIAPEVLNNRTIIPVRYVCDFFEINVLWNQWSENEAYIWLSPFELLSDDDVEPNMNYHKVYEDAPFYILNYDGVTARGIGIDDDYETVIEKYGEPHKTIDAAEKCIEYYTPYLPNSSSGSTLSIIFENNKVVRIELEF